MQSYSNLKIIIGKSTGKKDPEKNNRELIYMLKLEQQINNQKKSF